MGSNAALTPTRHRPTTRSATRNRRRVPGEDHPAAVKTDQRPLAVRQIPPPQMGEPVDGRVKPGSFICASSAFTAPLLEGSDVCEEVPAGLPALGYHRAQRQASVKEPARDALRRPRMLGNRHDPIVGRLSPVAQPPEGG
jgi:hypothetical protein